MSPLALQIHSVLQSFYRMLILECFVVCPREPFGGEGGDPFSDASFAGERITRVDIRSGNIIDA